METRLHKELCVIACMFDPPAFELIASTVTASDFHSLENRRLFQAATEIYNAGEVAEALDPVRLLDVCRNHRWDVRWETIAEAHGLPFMASTVHYHCQRLLAESRVERIHKLGELLTTTSVGDDEFIEESIQTLEEIRENTIEVPVVHAREAVREMLEIRANPAGRQGSGFMRLDHTLGGGLRDGQLAVIGGRPGAGKSVAMAQMCAHAAFHGRPAMIVSLEMASHEFMERLAKTIPTERLEMLPLFVADQLYDLPKIIGAAKVMARRHKIRLLAIDYLQLVDSGLGKAAANREQHVAHCSRAFKRLAKELRIPVIVGSQLNRESAKAAKRPTLADLRESGAIEQDADIVLLLSREDVTQPHTVMDLAKHRGGPTQVFNLDLVGREFRFEEKEAIDVDQNYSF